NRNAIQPAERKRPAIAIGTKDDVAPVVAPAVNLIVIAPARRKRSPRGIKRQLSRLPAIRRNNVNLFVSIILAGKRDPLSVRRESGEQLDARMRRQPGCSPARV